jgi:shikimate dehydrogenase
MRVINKDTKLFGSFSTNPGNNGCKYFNELFEKNNIDAIYKSFYCNDIEAGVFSAKTLNFSGFAISMPFKSAVLDYVDEIDQAVKEIGAANTVVNRNGKLVAYNTDWLGVYKYLLDPPKFITILGNGGFSKAVQYACSKLGIDFKVVTRENWDLVEHLEGTIFNATPVEVTVRGILIDGRPFTDTGKEIAALQAYEQYKLYLNE